MIVGENGRTSLLVGSGIRKVPQITAIFWIIKVLSTALGESTSDYLVHNIVPEIAVGMGFLGFLAALALQFKASRYVPWIYWLAVIMVAIFGTMDADVLHIQFGVPYVASTIFFSVALVAVFTAWYRVERTLSIHTIYTVRREGFYWLTVVTTFALGTAAGDMTARSINLGYLGSGILFLVLIAIPAAAHRWFELNSIVAFWFAYIVTRPLGASFADWTGKPQSIGGLNWGDGIVSLGLTILIVLCVAYLTITDSDSEVGRRPASQPS
jgi:uncharacterized membrane-anchored protein